MWINNKKLKIFRMLSTKQKRATLLRKVSQSLDCCRHYDGTSRLSVKFLEKRYVHGIR